MMLFKEHLAEQILNGTKTQTRRDWRRKTGPDRGKPYCRIKPGSVHQVRTSFFSPPVCHILITDVRRERLGDIGEEDVWREGVGSMHEFACTWIDINGSWDPDAEVYVVDFARVDTRELTADEGGGWLAEVPDYPGLMADGGTKEEALRELLGAWEAYKRAQRDCPCVDCQYGPAGEALYPDWCGHPLIAPSGGDVTDG